MSIRNLMEDVVIDVVNEIISKDKEFSDDDTNSDDIIAYVLNRIPAKYVTSERGIFHGFWENKYKIQQKSDILFLVYEAFDVIKGRRGTATKKNQDKSFAASPFPHIMGEVLEESTFSVIPDVEVSLLYNGKKAKMVDTDWKNPYATHRGTKGYYHFWPYFLESEMGKLKKYIFTLKFVHPKFHEKEVDIELEVLPGMDTCKSNIIPIVLLQAKEGVNLDFLY